jgi:hypothetical protein
MGCYFAKMADGTWGQPMYENCPGGHCGTPPDASGYTTGAIVFVPCA